MVYFYQSDDSSFGLFTNMIRLLHAQTGRLASLHQFFDFFVSVIETDLTSSQDIIVNDQDTSVGESFIAEEPSIHDLLEIGRFSMDTSNTSLKPLRRREIRSEEDLQDVLGLLHRQRASVSPTDQVDGMTFVVTL